MQLLKENPVISLADEKLALDPKQKVRQYLLVSKNEIASALFSPRKNTFLSLESVAVSPAHGIETALKSFFAERAFSKQGDITASRIIFVSNEHTLLPAAYFKQEEATELFNFNFDNDPEGVLCDQKINCFDVQLLYQVPASLLTVCSELLPGALYFHHSAGLMENFYLRYKNHPDSVVLLHLRHGAIDLVVKSGRKLVLLNTFSCKTPEDILYHTLNTYEQLQLNPENEKLVLAGSVDSDSDICKLLFRYIRQVEFADRPSVASFSYVFDALPPQSYHSLFTTVLCES